METTNIDCFLYDTSKINRNLCIPPQKNINFQGVQLALYYLSEIIYSMKKCQYSEA